MHRHGRCKICSFTNRLVLEFLGFAQTMILSFEEGLSFVL